MSVYRPSIKNDLASLEAFFDGAGGLASILGVDKSQLTRWRKQTYPGIVNLARIYGANFVISRLFKNFKHADSVKNWLNGINAHLHDRKPIDLIKAGRFSEVLDAIDAYEEGTFA